MCGIAGFANADGSIDSALFDRLARRIDHRGPDDSGYLYYSPDGLQLSRELRCAGPLGRCALASRRLAILDLGEQGWQPMGTSDGRYYIVFNGEIYNYLELRHQLESAGHQFRSQSDTEVLLTAFAYWGKNALTRLVGMFAFAILDTIERRLFLARDFFGIKPLYYTIWRGGFVFSSEIKSLLELPDLKRRANPNKIYLYLRFGETDQSPETLLEEIQQLPPGHYMEVPLDHTYTSNPICYWKPSLGRPLDISFEEAASRLRDLFLESVRLHLRSDVPVGAALSGGIDSSSIVAAMRHLQGRNLEIHAFSFIANDPQISEERWIELLGRSAGVVIHKVRASPGGLTHDLDALITSQDEPFGSTSIYAQYRVFQVARQTGIKVMLDGQGADEILGGYRYFLAARLASLIRQAKWSDAVSFLRKASTAPGTGAFWLLSRSADHLLPESLKQLARRSIGRDLIPHWLNTAWFADRGVVPRSSNRRNGHDVLRRQMLETTMETSLPHLLRYEDRNSMAFSIESRVPFLTPRFVNFTLSLPEQFVIAPDGTSKAVFRRAMRGLVPDEILNRRDKIGFATPERAWLTELRPWVEQCLVGEGMARLPPLDRSGIHHEWEQILRGKRSFGAHIWRWINLSKWSQQQSVRYD
jgi:asparagine synthase (glutamine-hydrolysing)